MRGAVALVTLAACGRIGFDEADTSRRQKPITFENVITPVTNFRLPFDLGADPDLAPHVATAYFVDATGAILPQELEGSTAWVLVPNIAEGTTLRVRYGGDPEPPNPAPVWAGMIGVWHLTDNDLQFRDSSGAGHTGLPVGAPTEAPGIAGRARAFDGIDDSIFLGDPPDDGLDVGTSSITYSLWVHVTSPVGTFDVAFWKGGSSTTYPGYDIECGAGGWTANLSDGASVVGANFAVSTAALIGRWVFLAAVVDRSTNELRTYVDGLPIETIDIVGIGSLSSSNPARLGDGTLTEPFHGIIDEFRIEVGVVSAAELYVRFQVLAAPQNVYTIGPEEHW